MADNNIVGAELTMSLDAAKILVMQGLAGKAPRINLTNFHWEVWSNGTQSWVDTGISAVNGAPGADGADGVSPVITVSSITGGHRLTITDAEHPSGQTVDVMDGTDGYTPTISVAQETNGITVTISDGHPHGTINTYFIPNGQDYVLTNADKQAISNLLIGNVPQLVTDWMDANISGETTVVVDSSLSISGAAADAKATGDTFGLIGAAKVLSGESSDNTDIVINSRLESTDFIRYKVYNGQNGNLIGSTKGSCCNKFLVKPNSEISLDNTLNVHFWDKSGTFISSESGTVTVPENAYKAAISCYDSISFSKSATTGYVARTNFFVEAEISKSDILHVDWDNVDNKELPDTTLRTAGKYADAKAVGDAVNGKLNVQLGFNAVESDTISLGWNFKNSDFVDGEYLDLSNGEIKTGTKCCRSEVKVKPGSSIALDVFNVVFYNYYHAYIGSHVSGIGVEITVPENACYMGLSCDFKGMDEATYVVERANKMKTNARVSAFYLEYPTMHINMSDENFEQISEFLSTGSGEISRVMSAKTIQTSNRMRHAWRVASFNTYGTGGAGNRNWTAIKELLQECGIDMIGFQEVNNPNVADSSGKTFEQALTSWHLSQFGIIQTEAVPNNCRPVATTGEFEVVSITETKYTTQSNYGNRYFTRTEVKLPRWKDKKASENFKVSIYNTQLEVGTSAANNNTRLAQAAQLIAAMNADTNPFIILVGDFNEMSVGWDTVNAIKNAGYTPQLEDTSTPTAGRGFYDFIFVNERIAFLENEVVPYDLHYYYPGGVQANISDHDLVFADVVFDYENLISVKTSLPNCTLSGGTYWLDRRQTEPVVYTVTPDEGYTVQSISTGQGDNDLTYNNGAVVLSGNTVTIKPNLVVGDVWINVTTAAAS